MGFAGFQSLRKEIIVSLSKHGQESCKVFSWFHQRGEKSKCREWVCSSSQKKTMLLFAYTQLNRAYFSNSWHIKTELGLSLSIPLFALVYFSLYLHIQPLFSIQSQISSFPGNFPNFQSAHPLFLLWSCIELQRTFCKTSIPSMLAFIAHICFHLSYSTCAIRIEFPYA